MKKLIIVIPVVIVLSFFALTFFIIEYKNNKVFNETSYEEVRSIYISYIEFDNYIKGKKEEVSKKNIENILDNVKEYGFNTVIVHVRPFSDSIYKSKYFPISNTVLNDKGLYPDYDVLSFFIDETHKRNMKFEAWINPFRISNISSLSNIPIDSPYYKFLKEEDAKIFENGIYLNPASEKVRELIVNGIKEIVENYNVDGIHFDDYFYPNKMIDLKSYEEYKEKNGLLSLENYRYNNILTLIKDVYKSIKSIKKDVVFGIAPQGNIDNDYQDCFLDVKEILSKEGYVDYIMPEVYYGFLNGVKPYKETINEWNSLIGVNSIKLIPALAFYKNGKIDKYAKDGINEWIDNSDIIKKQIEYARSLTHYDGFSIFSYDYLFNSDKKTNNTDLEIRNMLSLLDNKTF